MNAVDILRDHARTRPDAAALVDETGRGRRVITFAELDAAASRAAGMLRAAGLRPGAGDEPGDTVLVMQPLSIDLYIILLAVLRARLTAMFVDRTAGMTAVEEACRMVPPRALAGVATACVLRFASPALRRIPIVYTTGSIGGYARRWSAWRKVAPIPDEPCPDATPALITFTSGSTGAPKVAVRSHGFLLAQHRALAPALDLQPDDIVATTFPVFVLSHLGAGACTLLTGARGRHGEKRCMRPAQLARVTALAAAPAACADLFERAKGEGVRLPSLRRVIAGGGPVFPSLLDSLRAVAPQATITTLYGSTEAEPIAHVGHDQVSMEDVRDMRSGRGLLVGAPVREINLRVLRDDFRAVSATRAEFDAAVVPAGSAGEIVVSGAHVLSGYYRGMRDEETKFRVDGVVWHRTGDAGFLDERGRVWLLGRVGARVRDEHGDLYPFQVEVAADAEPGVQRSAFVARGASRLLWVELRRGADPATTENLRQRLAWAHLGGIVVCERIPTDHRHHSKVDYGALEKIPGVAR